MSVRQVDSRVDNLSRAHDRANRQALSGSSLCKGNQGLSCVQDVVRPDHPTKGPLYGPPLKPCEHGFASQGVRAYKRDRGPHAIDNTDCHALSKAPLRRLPQGVEHQEEPISPGARPPELVRICSGSREVDPLGALHYAHGEERRVGLGRVAPVVRAQAHPYKILQESKWGRR